MIRVVKSPWPIRQFIAGASRGVSRWTVETPAGSVTFVGKSAANRAAAVARAGADITRMSLLEIGSAFMLWKHGTEEHPGKAGPAWAAFLKKNLTA